MSIICPQKWIRKENIGSGSYGTVYRSCCEDDCSFVMKKFRKKNFNKKQFLKEVKIQERLEGIAPPIHHVDIERRVIIMDSLKRDFLSFVKDELAKAVSEKTKKSNIRSAIFDILRLIMQMHKAGIAHGDLHGGNLMQDCAGKWHLIDFGLAMDKATREKKKNDFKDLWNTVYGLTLDNSSLRIDSILSPSLKLAAKALLPPSATRSEIENFIKTQKFFE